MRKVPKGTNGGVSLIGTMTSLLGGFLVGLSFYIALKLSLLFSGGSLVAESKLKLATNFS
jgi:uncharacterized membrane protein